MLLVHSNCLIKFQAKIKEALLIERLKRYEVPKAQGPVVEPIELTGEERFFLKKIAQKKSNYAPVGRRGIFGGVILNMHMHWKKHETVKVICKPCKPGQVHEYADEIARLSGGIPIHVIGDNTIIFYRGKNYVQPQVMSPVDTLSKKKVRLPSSHFLKFQFYCCNIQHPFVPTLVQILQVVWYFSELLLLWIVLEWFQMDRNTL